jgi:uncharacterized protein (TIGR02001 family)
MTQKTNLVITCAALALGALSARGQTPAPETAVPVAAAPSSSWTVTPAFVTDYMFRGVRLAGFSFEPNIEFDSGNLGLGVWANFPISDKVVGQSDPEIDPYGYYTITLNDSTSIVPGFTWYNYPNAKTANGFYKGTFEPSLALNYTVGGIKFTPKVYYDFVLEGPTLEVTAAFALPLKEAGTELDFSATLGTYKWKSAIPDVSPDVENRGDYFQVGVSAPFAVTKDSKFIVGVAYVEGSSNSFTQAGIKADNTAAIGRFVATLSYAITF